MADMGAEFRRCLIEVDVVGVRRVWAHQHPGLPQPPDDEDVLASLHIARTASQSVPFKLRAYSHAWCSERGLPSQLPDQMRPAAERIYPVITPAVGIAVKARTSSGLAAALVIRGAMENAVQEAIADNKLTDSPYVKARMLEARAKTISKLYG
jgi:phage gp29-like protein